MYSTGVETPNQQRNSADRADERRRGHLGRGWRVLWTDSGYEPRVTPLGLGGGAPARCTDYR